MAVRKFNYQFDEVKYYRCSVYRLGSNVQTVYVYVIDDILIDTAQRHNRENIDKILTENKINKILLTHFHEDHSGNVNYIVNMLNIDAYAHPKACEILRKGYKMSPLGSLLSGHVENAHLKPLTENETVMTAHFKLQPVYTPGHCDDHYCYFEKDKGYLFSGDIYVADKIKYFAPYENIFEQIRSLEKLLGLDFDVLFCSHNPKTQNGKQHIANKLQFFQDFTGTVSNYFRQGHNTSKSILELMQLKENHFYKVITLGNFTTENMIKSVLKGLKQPVK
ncbi:MAG TPA: MBL fold metallo-hydrolase [Chitinophagales bacterium]|nr:MBL fold metallo-hydrolase [Chitinophagales bacterium]